MDTHILQGGLSLVSWRKSACSGEIPQTDRQIYVLEYKMRTKRRCGMAFLSRNKWYLWYVKKGCIIICHTSMYLYQVPGTWYVFTTV